MTLTRIWVVSYWNDEWHPGWAFCSADLANSFAAARGDAYKVYKVDELVLTCDETCEEGS